MPHDCHDAIELCELAEPRADRNPQDCHELTDAFEFSEELRAASRPCVSLKGLSTARSGATMRGELSWSTIEDEGEGIRWL